MSNVGDGTGFPPERPPLDKLYLGDGVYLTFLVYGIALTTENGVAVTNRIILEPDVYAALVKYMQRRADG